SGVRRRPARDDRCRADDVPRGNGDVVGADDRCVLARARAAMGTHDLRRDPALPDRVRGRLRHGPAAAAARDRPVAQGPRAALALPCTVGPGRPADGGTDGVVTTDELLTARGLTKRFGGVAAVEDCTFSVPSGSITAL